MLMSYYLDSRNAYLKLWCKPYDLLTLVDKVSDPLKCNDSIGFSSLLGFLYFLNKFVALFMINSRLVEDKTDEKNTFYYLALKNALGQLLFFSEVIFSIDRQAFKFQVFKNYN